MLNSKIVDDSNFVVITFVSIKFQLIQKFIVVLHTFKHLILINKSLSFYLILRNICIPHQVQYYHHIVNINSHLDECYLKQLLFYKWPSAYESIYHGSSQWYHLLSLPLKRFPLLHDTNPNLSHNFHKCCFALSEKFQFIFPNHSKALLNKIVFCYLSSFKNII